MDLPSVVGSSILQVLLFAAIPFAVYAISRRRVRGFFDYVGLRKPTGRAMLLATLFILLTAPLPLLLYLLPEFRAISLAPGTVGGDFARLGLSVPTTIAILIVAFVQAGLAEEILFRGFVAKRLIGWLGFSQGNALQAVVFAAPHLLVFAVPGGPSASPLNLALVFVSPFVVGWIFGYLNERIGNGSVAPSWWCHGFGNAVAYGAAAVIQ